MKGTIGVVREAGSSEKRVAIVPDAVPRAADAGYRVLVEHDAGYGINAGDSEYEGKGAEVATRKEVLEESDIIPMLHRPSNDDIAAIKRGSTVIGLIYPGQNKGIVESMAAAGLRSYSLELVPRTTRAQGMDVLSSQSSAAGYRAALIAASHSTRMMPMLTTAAGTVPPARALVIGAGVAGLMAIATLRRLGSRVYAFDVRKSAGDDVRSLGAVFLEASIDASGGGGYARDLSEEENRKQDELILSNISAADVVITAAGIPGRKSPRIVTESMVSAMKKGSVIVDLVAESGGNCELTRPGSVVMHNGVAIHGPMNLPADVPLTSSSMYSRNVLSFIEYMTEEGRSPDTDDILGPCLVTDNGKVVYSGEKDQRGVPG